MIPLYHGPHGLTHLHASLVFINYLAGQESYERPTSRPDDRLRSTTLRLWHLRARVSCNQRLRRLHRRGGYDGSLWLSRDLFCCPSINPRDLVAEAVTHLAVRKNCTSASTRLAFGVWVVLATTTCFAPGPVPRNNAWPTSQITYAPIALLDRKLPRRRQITWHNRM